MRRQISINHHAAKLEGSDEMKKLPALKFADGMRLRNGQIIADGSAPLGATQKKRGLTMRNIAREGEPKNTVAEIPTTHGMKRQTAPSHDWLHGAPIDDEPNTPLAPKSYEKQVAVHPGMTAKQRAGIHPTENDPSAILRGNVAPRGVK